MCVCVCVLYFGHFKRLDIDILLLLLTVMRNAIVEYNLLSRRVLIFYFPCIFTYHGEMLSAVFRKNLE